MKKHKNGSKIAYITIVLAVIAVLLLVGGFISRFTNNFTSDFKTFYIEYDGKMITSDKTDIEFVRGEPNLVKVGYSLGFLNKEKSNYNVNVLPNITDDTDFEYTVDGKYYKYSDIKDLTDYFQIVKSDDYFFFQSNATLNEIFQSMYAGKTITGIPQGDGEANLLKLVISSEDNSVSISLAFRFIPLPTSIVIYPDTIKH